VLIKWQGLESSVATWEDKSEMREHYPNFNLEDNIVVNGGSIVRESIMDPIIDEEIPIIGMGPQALEDKRQVAQSPHVEEVRKSTRVKRPNPKYLK
jgi:hypothetical protein